MNNPEAWPDTFSWTTDFFIDTLFHYIFARGVAGLFYLTFVQFLIFIKHFIELHVSMYRLCLAGAASRLDLPG